jgi:hypothetical protein
MQQPFRELELELELLWFSTMLEDELELLELELALL